MGSSVSKSSTKCETSQPPSMASNEKFGENPQKVPYEAPPALQMPMSFEEKMWAKFTKQPLVPLGCLATAYFLISGLKSFRNRDPRRAQKMMRARVGAQFATLAAFVGYVGFDNVNFDVAPAYYRAKEADAVNQKEMARDKSSKDSEN